MRRSRTHIGISGRVGSGGAQLGDLLLEARVLLLTGGTQLTLFALLSLGLRRRFAQRDQHPTQ